MALNSNLPSLEALVSRYGGERVWGVVSTYAADSFDRALTYAEAEQLAAEEAREPGQSATIVLIVADKSPASEV